MLNVLVASGLSADVFSGDGIQLLSLAPGGVSGVGVRVCFSGVLRLSNVVFPSVKNVSIKFSTTFVTA